MRKLETFEMEQTVGSELTEEEIDAFLCAASCTATIFGGPLAIFSGLSCLDCTGII